jgi:hypothetical protein
MKTTTLSLCLLPILLLALGGCTATMPSTSSSFVAPDGTLDTNNGQNAQFWATGDGQTGAAQLDSGVISSDVTNWQGTGLSNILALTKNGAQVKNSGDLTADTLSIQFGEPYADGDGQTIVPIQSIEIAGLVNNVSAPIDSLTSQVGLWVSVLAEISEDQRDQVIAALERDKVITQETAGLVRAALEAVSPAP